MTQYDWFVDFEKGHGVCVRAFSREEAVILAKAQRIKNGLEWRNVSGATCQGTSRPRRRRRSSLA